MSKGPAFIYLESQKEKRKNRAGKRLKEMEPKISVKLSKLQAG